MDWVYLSPHLDDAALSCGGLLANQRRAGDRVIVLNICAGDPPEGSFSPFAQMLHSLWGFGRDVVSRRRAEDRRACEILGAEGINFPIPDCIYRRSSYDGRPFYASEDAIFGPPDPEELPLIEDLARRIAAALPQEGRLVSPLAIGGHVDHRLTRTAAESLGTDLWYYADYPYVELDTRWLAGRSGEGAESDWSSTLFPLADSDLYHWQQAVAAYRSQWPVFWTDEKAMAEALSVYRHRFGGALLWKKANLC